MYYLRLSIPKKKVTLPPKILVAIYKITSIPVAAGSKAWVFGRSLTGIVGSNPDQSMDVCLL
jgi:hypothetical protein